MREITLCTGIIVCVRLQKYQSPGCFNFCNADWIVEPVQTECGRIRNQCAEDGGTIWTSCLLNPVARFWFHFFPLPEQIRF